MEVDRQDDVSNSAGIIRQLGELPPDTVLSEEALARIFSRHRVSIKRAVERGELPPSVRLFGEPVWTVQALRAHMNRRLDEAKKEAERLARRISQNNARLYEMRKVVCGYGEEEDYTNGQAAGERRRPPEHGNNDSVQAV